MKNPLLFLAILSSSILFSAPVGAPSAPALLEQGFCISDRSWSNFRVGYIQDFLIYQRTAGDGTQSPSVKGLSSIATLTWNIRERLDLQLFSGSGQIQWKFLQNNIFISGQSTSSWIWGGGGKIVLLEVKDTSISVLGSGGYWQRMEGTYCYNDQPEKQSTNLEMRYWQLGAGLSQKMGRFYPYMGCAVQRTRLRMRLTTGFVKLHEEHRLGPFLGCTLTNGIQYMVNLEWRGYFEQGLTGSCEIRF